MQAAKHSSMSVARNLAKNHIEVASQQAHIFAGLMSRHCDVELYGNDLSDFYANLFHGTDWNALMLSLEGESSTPYYAISPKVPLLALVGDIDKLLGKRCKHAIRALVDMPQAQYSKARTMPGAKLATMLAGRPTWSLSNSTRRCDTVMVTDTRDDSQWMPLSFNSDPMTNSERVNAVHPESAVMRVIPIEKVIHTSGMSFTVAEAMQQVRDPAERWSPSYKHLRSFLPEAEQADSEFIHTLNSIIKGPNADGMIKAAMRRYNQVLMQGVEAFWLDTREINSREAIFQAFGTSDPEQRLAFSSINPLIKIKELMGESSDKT